MQDTSVVETREVKHVVPLVRPEAPRLFFGPRKLPTPPPSTNECSVPRGHARAASHSTLASSYTPARSTPPSTVHSEKWPESTSRIGVPIRMEPPKRETSLEYTQTNLKFETTPPIISQNSKRRTLREALAQGLQRIGSLVVSVFLCRH